MAVSYRLIKSKLPYGKDDDFEEISINQDAFDTLLNSLKFYCQYTDRCSNKGDNMYFRDHIITYESMHDIKYEKQRKIFIKETISKILSLIQSSEDTLAVIAHMIEEIKIEEKIFHTIIIYDYISSLIGLSYTYRYRYTLPYEIITSMLLTLGTYNNENNYEWWYISKSCRDSSH